MMKTSGKFQQNGNEILRKVEKEWKKFLKDEIKKIPKMKKAYKIKIPKSH